MPELKATDRGHKKSQAKDRSDPALRQRERKKNECGAEKSKGQAKYEPGMLIAARMQVVGKGRVAWAAFQLGFGE